jgi:hypothetical protein
MDTQTPFQSPQSTPPVSPTPPQNKRWEIVLGAVLLLVIVGTCIYFVAIKKDSTPTTQVVDQTTPQVQDDSQQIKNFTVGDVKNAYLSKPYLDDRNFYIVPGDQNDILLKDGSAIFTYCEQDPACSADKNKKGTVTVSSITASTDPSLLKTYAGGADGVADGVAIITFDFGNSDKEYYLGAFAFSNYESKNHVYFSNVKNLGVLEGSVQSVAINNNGEINLSIKTPSGSLLSRMFMIISGRSLNTFVELTSDKTQKIYDDQKLGYSFTYPKAINITRGQSLRATVMENDLKTSPIYYAQECGLQPSFADNTVPFWSSMTSADGQSSVNLSATLTAHKVASQTLYLTSALYGYDPADWGKIKQQVSIQTYLNDVKSGSPVTGRKVTLENIGGVSVKHIMPFSIGRPCDDQNREQYQWVKGDLFFNLIFTDSKTQPASTEQKSALINSIFSSLKLK